VLWEPRGATRRGDLTGCRCALRAAPRRPTGEAPVGFRVTAMASGGASYTFSNRPKEIQFFWALFYIVQYLENSFS